MRKRGPGRPKGSKNGARKPQKRGRKHIFTPAQKRVLGRMIAGALKRQLRALARAL